MHLLITLLLAHLFADFPLQTNGLAKLKKTHLSGVLIHVLIYMVVTALLLQNPFHYWPLIVGVAVAHFLIDAAKINCKFRNEVNCFVLDQFLHFISVALAAYLAHQYWSPAPVGILPDTLLLAAFLCAFALAIMVFCWVWTNGLSDEQINRHVFLRWAKDRMLPLEQRIGLVLVILVFIGQLMIYNLS